MPSAQIVSGNLPEIVLIEINRQLQFGTVHCTVKCQINILFGIAEYKYLYTLWKPFGNREYKCFYLLHSFECTIIRVFNEELTLWKVFGSEYIYLLLFLGVPKGIKVWHYTVVRKQFDDYFPTIKYQCVLDRLLMC